MAKKKSKSKKHPDELQQQINLHFLELVDKVRALDRRVRGLVTYSEYIARNLDLSVSYAEYLSKIISRDRNSLTFKAFDISPNEKVPTFEDFKRIRLEKDDEEIPF